MSYYFFFLDGKKKERTLQYFFTVYDNCQYFRFTFKFSLSPNRSFNISTNRGTLVVFFSNKPYLKVLQGYNNLYPTLISIPDLLRLFLRFFFSSFFLFSFGFYLQRIKYRIYSSGSVYSNVGKGDG